ncbi:MAG TPA: glycoside hydrolase family 172 protein, partial [Fimbriimonadaceae bacterium]|nr:glycoside hydrolase family 172 protein [Fimbriimonadaceae bacterium]
MIGFGSLAQLPFLRDYESRRSSSYDRTGGNEDWVTVAPGSSTTLLSNDRPGCVKHIWLTVGNDDLYPRKCVIRMWWDGEEQPSVEVPLGDFFGIGHGLRRNFTSVPLQMSPEDGRGFNCWWPMPFNAARIEVQNECEGPINLYFYVDWEEFAEPVPGSVARFHAQWRRENPTEGWLKERLTPENYLEIWRRKPNSSDADNYVILEAEGNGIYVGCNLNV